MLYITVFAALFASLLWAQDLTGLPACAVTCFENNFVNTQCAVTNTTCLCNDTTFYGDVESCVAATCDITDALTTLTWAQTKCGS